MVFPNRQVTQLTGHTGRPSSPIPLTEAHRGLGAIHCVKYSAGLGLYVRVSPEPMT